MYAHKNCFLFWSTFSSVSQKKVFFSSFSLLFFYNEFTSLLSDTVPLASIKMTGAVLDGARAFELESHLFALQTPTLGKGLKVLFILLKDMEGNPRPFNTLFFRITDCALQHSHFSF